MKNGSIALSLSLALLGATVVLPSAQSQRRGFASAPAGHVGGIFSRGGMRAGSLRMRAAGGLDGGVHAYAPYFYGDSGSDYTPDYEPAPFLPQSSTQRRRGRQAGRAAAGGTSGRPLGAYHADALPQTNGQLAGQASAPLPERNPPPAKATAASAQSPPASPLRFLRPPCWCFAMVTRKRLASTASWAQPSTSTPITGPAARGREPFLSPTWTFPQR